MEPMNDDQRLSRWQKRQLVLALAVTCLLAALWMSLAWLNHTRSLVTATEVHVPALWIDDIHGANAMNLGEIDVQKTEDYTTDKKPCRRYVFAVCSSTSDPFRIQLAYTTNIPFGYKLYPSVEGTTKEGSFVMVNTSDGPYYYTYSEPLSALNDRMPVQNHNETYKTIIQEQNGTETSCIYDNVHSAAKPLYWISGDQKLAADNSDTEGAQEVKKYVVHKDDTSPYIRYYVLEISWDSSLINNKETDLVYLMAESVGS